MWYRPVQLSRSSVANWGATCTLSAIAGAGAVQGRSEGVLFVGGVGRGEGGDKGRRRPTPSHQSSTLPWLHGGAAAARTLGGVAPSAKAASYRRCASPAMAPLMSLALTVAPCSAAQRSAAQRSARVGMHCAWRVGWVRSRVARGQTAPRSRSRRRTD